MVRSNPRITPPHSDSFAETIVDRAAEASLPGSEYGPVGAAKIDGLRLEIYRTTTANEVEYVWALWARGVRKPVGGGVLHRSIGPGGALYKAAEVDTAAILRSYQGKSLYTRVLKVVSAILRVPLRSDETLSDAASRAWQKAGARLVVHPSGTTVYEIQPPHPDDVKVVALRRKAAR